MARTAIVTGGESGLGQACVERFRADGIKTISCDLADTADQVVDISDPESVHAAVDAAIEDGGPVDILVNSAGIVGPNVPLWDTPEPEWRKTFDVNVHGTFNMCQAVIPGMMAAGWGRIVNIASIAGKDGNPQLSAYSASKAAVIGMTKSLGKELATTGVIVNAIAPAVIATPLNAKTAPEVLARLTSLIPMGRLGEPAEVSALVAWLVSDECSFSTGAVFDLSGGRAVY